MLYVRGCMMKLLSSHLQKLFYLVWHHGFVFFQTVRGLPPILIWGLMIGLFYDFRYPVDIGPTYMTAAPWLFFVMVWFGYLFLTGFNQTAEHIMILQINSRKRYHASRFIFLLSICAILCVAGCVYPLIVHYALRLRGIAFFTNGLRTADFFGAFLLHMIYGGLGVSLSLLFQPHSAKRRDNFSLSMLFLFTLLSYAKDQLVDIYSGFRYSLWLFPPVMDIARRFVGDKTFAAHDLAMAALYGLVYSAVAVTAGQWIYNRRAYGPRMASMENKANEP